MAYDPSIIIANAINQSTAMANQAALVLGSALGNNTGDVDLSTYPTLPINPIRAPTDANSDPFPVYKGKRYAPVDAPDDDLDMDAIPSRNYGQPPTFDETPPDYKEPPTPAELAAFDGTAPTLELIDLPEVPDLPLSFEPPELKDIVIPDAPVISLPEFTTIRPILDVDAPDDLDELFKREQTDAFHTSRRIIESEFDLYLATINPEYHSQMAKLEARLSQYIDGGTALPVEVEQAIYNRARDKTNAEYLKTRDAVWEEGAKRGFTLPGGAQYAAMARARQNAADNNARAAMDIAIKQAEMEQQNIQFALTQSANLRGVVLNAAVSVVGQLVQLNAQSIEQARQVLMAVLEVYNAQIKLVTTEVELYRADAEIYQTQLKAALAVYDVYRAQLEGVKAQVDIDQAKITAFTAQVNAWGAVASLYKTQVDGVVAAAQVEKLKADIFGTQVQAYSAQVSAKQSEWQAFTAQVQGEIAKQGVFESQVKSYNAEIGAYTNKIHGYKAEVEGIVARNEGSVKKYLADWQGYITEVQGEIAVVDNEMKLFDYDVRTFMSKHQLAMEQAKLDLSANEADLRSAISLYQVNTTNAIQSAKIHADAVNGRATVAVAAGNSYAAMASSALSGMNSLAQTSEITNL